MREKRPDDNSAVPRLILDTNVLVAAMRSKRGASFKLLWLFRQGRFRLALSVPLVLEYEDVLMRDPGSLLISSEKIGDLLDQICNAGDKYGIHFLWRPFLRDPKDDFILELAIASGTRHIVTYNTKDFTNLEKFDIQVVTPKEMLEELGELS